MSFTSKRLGFYWVRLDLNEFSPSVNVFQWVLPGFTGFYRVFLWILLGFTVSFSKNEQILVILFGLIEFC